MRTRLLVTVALAALLAAGACLPLVDNTKREPVPGRLLAIVIQDPAINRTVAQGTKISISWTVGNLTGQPATVSLVAESRLPALTRTTLTDAIAINGSGDSGTLDWDTSKFAGPYRVIGTIVADSITDENTSAGLITVDAAPVFEFTAPTASVIFHPATDPPLTIAWSGGDESATVRIGLDPDTDHNNGNETFILERALPTVTGPDSFAWGGNDPNGTPVPADTYNLFASASDNVNPTVLVDAPGQVTVVR